MPPFYPQLSLRGTPLSSLFIDYLSQSRTKAPAIQQRRCVYQHSNDGGHPSPTLCPSLPTVYLWLMGHLGYLAHERVAWVKGTECFHNSSLNLGGHGGPDPLGSWRIRGQADAPLIISDSPQGARALSGCVPGQRMLPGKVPGDDRDV